MLSGMPQVEWWIMPNSLFIDPKTANNSVFSGVHDFQWNFSCLFTLSSSKGSVQLNVDKYRCVKKMPLKAI